MEEAAARKERLEALRQAAKLSESDATEGDKPVLKFRNYLPKDQKIEHTKVRAHPTNLESRRVEVAVLCVCFFVFVSLAAPGAAQKSSLNGLPGDSQTFHYTTV